MKKLTALLLVLALLGVCPALAEAPAAPEAADLPEEPVDPVRQTILDAMEVYSWFVMNPLEVDTNAPAQEDGVYPVLDETLGSTEGMQARLDEYFSTEISQSLWAWGTYHDIDGWLFGRTLETSPLARPIDPDISDAFFELTEETEKKRVYTVTVCYLSADEPVKLEFVSELVAGKWIFTEFPFFW